MKVTVELSDSELKDICRLTGERKKGPAIRKMVVQALMMKRREEISGKFISGDWGMELRGIEESRAKDRKLAALRSAKWRGQTELPRVKTDSKTGLPVIQCKHTATRRPKLTPDRVAKILSAQEIKWARGSG